MTDISTTRDAKTQRRGPSTGFPSLPLAEAAKAMKRAGTYGYEHQVEALAQYMGHSTANSGAFKAKLASLRDFGLVAGRGDNISLSELAQSIAHPESEEAERAALRESFFKSEVFAKVHDSLAKGVELDVDGIGNAAIRNFGVAASSKQTFVDSFVASAVEAGVAERMDDRRVRVLPRSSTASSEGRRPNTADAQTADAAANATLQRAPEQRRGAAPTALYQSWDIEGGQLVFEIRSDRPLAADAFSQIAKVIEESQRLAALLTPVPPDPAGTSAHVDGPA